MKKEAIKMFTIRLTEGLHTQMRIHVAKNRTSIQKWLLELIQRDLGKNR